MSDLCPHCKQPLPANMGPVRVWYMRDDHTFVELPLDDEDRAIDRLRTVLNEPDGYSKHGMLASHQLNITHHHRFGVATEDFLREVRLRLRSARAVAAPPVTERVRSGSLFLLERPELCGRDADCGVGARVVRCADPVDVVECVKCGKQWETRCTFDEDYA